MPEDYRDPEVLRRLYVDEGKSLVEMSALLYANEGTIRHYMKLHGIPTRRQGRRSGGSSIGSGRKPETYVKVGDEMLTVKQVAERAGIGVETARVRIKKGMRGDRLLEPRQDRAKKKHIEV